MLSADEGTAAVRAARRVTEAETEGKTVDAELPESFSKMRMGVFVTINEYPSGYLRGCIGYPVPPFSLDKTLVAAARGVCYDERFPRLRPSQAKRCIFEVTFLTEPVKIDYKDVEDLKSQIEIGKDGLSVRYVRNAGLVNSAIYLPQVPVEQEWDIVQYLSSLCMKAGLQDDAWKSGALEFFKFQGEEFGETEPSGDVIRK